MARVTVEDCIDRIPNQFELVILSAQLAKDVNLGAHNALKDSARNKKFAEKASVIALRRIASGNDVPENLIKQIVTSFLQVPNSRFISPNSVDVPESVDVNKDTVRIKTGLSSSMDNDSLKLFEDIDVIEESEQLEIDFEVRLENSSEPNDIALKTDSSIQGTKVEPEKQIENNKFASSSDRSSRNL